MTIMILFLVGSGLISCGIFYAIYLKKKKNDKLERDNFKKLPLIIGIVNLILATFILLLFINNPQSFQTQQDIVWNIGTVLFTIFTVYFYILALPLSIGEILVTVLLKKDKIVSSRYFYASIIMNSLSVALLSACTMLIFT